MRTAPINPGAKTTYRKVPSDLGYPAPLWCNLAHKRVAGNFPETSRGLRGRQPSAPQNVGMGCCGLHQSIRGQKPLAPIGKCPQIWAVLPHCGATDLAHKRVAGNSPETSSNLPGRQPAAPQNLRMGCCALHQSIRGQKPTIGKCPQMWAVLPHCGATVQIELGHKRLTGNFLETSKKVPWRQLVARAMGCGWPHGPQA